LEESGRQYYFREVTDNIGTDPPCCIWRLFKEELTSLVVKVGWMMLMLNQCLMGKVVGRCPLQDRELLDLLQGDCPSDFCLALRAF
jgi:hypothetical protein